MSVKIKLVLLLGLIATAWAVFYLRSKSGTMIKRSLSARFDADEVSKPVKQHDTRDGEDLPRFTFDDLYSSKFSYSTFYPNWVSSSEYLLRDGDGIKKYDLDTSTFVTIVSNEFYESTRANGWSLSSDEQFLLARQSYTKQWRYSYNASYAIYNITSEEQVLSTSSDIQYIGWPPTGHGAVWVQGNDLYYATDVSDSSTYNRLTTDGGKNTIFNGVPDWVYEEEMVSSTNNIFWSPDSQYLAYLITDDTDVERIEFSKYNDYQYPEMLKVAYPKAGTTNPKVTLKILDITSGSSYTVIAPVDLIGSDHLFCDFHWYGDAKAFLVYWLNRISNVAVTQLCQSSPEGWKCSVVQAGGEESTSGWIGNGGTPFSPKFVESGAENISSRSYFSAFSNSEGYWHIALVDTETDTRTFLTSGTSVVTSVQYYDDVNGWLYFLAAYPMPRKRQLFRISTNMDSYPIPDTEWESLTEVDFDADRCAWISPSFGPSGKYLVINCGGPDVPLSTLQRLGSDGDYDAPQVVVSNDDLVTNKAEVKWPIKEYGEINSENGITILYQIHKPMDFDETKKYPLLIEVYGGPGFQKVQDRWTRGWAQVHMVSQYDIIVVSLDGRGSGYRGDGIAHMLYKKLGQLEKEDTTEVGRYFAQKSWVDETRMSVWGWSYGGYTTTFTISEGAGVFKCGIAVAPLATRFLYDSIHTERYMDLPKNNEDGYEKCSILNSNLNNFKSASYSIIHGTADDNVHFQNAARISKALIAADVDFDDFYYADEAHSINSGPNASRHIYKLLTKKTRQCFDLAAPAVSANKSKLGLLSRYIRKAGNKSPRIQGAKTTSAVQDYLGFRSGRSQESIDFL